MVKDHGIYHKDHPEGRVISLRRYIFLCILAVVFSFTFVHEIEALPVATRKSRIKHCMQSKTQCSTQLNHLSNPQPYSRAATNHRKQSRHSIPLFLSFMPEEEKKPKPLPELQYMTTPPASKPKPILVIGATGRVGRLVVKELLSLNLQVRAFVRDYQLACDVFSNFIDEEDKEFVTVSGQSGNNLQIVEGDLAPEDASHEDDYGYEALESAIKGCGTIISCAGTIRPSRIRDYIPPSKIWNIDVRKWCRDRSHPYYVNYIGMKKLMEFVKLEVEKREKIQQDENEKNNGRNGNSESSPVEPITVVRISDLYVGLPPWSFVTILTNLARSMIFRYQELAEQVLIQESSSKVKTILLRPGDLTDDERDPSKANLQISPQGILPSPSMVSRADVAALAVTAAMASDSSLSPKFSTSTSKKMSNNINSKENQNEPEILPLPNSLTLAVRWVGEDIYPQSQGTMQDGFKDAETCLKKLQTKGAMSTVVRNRIPPSILRSRGKMKPYGIFASVLLTSVLVMVANLLFFAVSSNSNISHGIQKAFDNLSKTVMPFMGSKMSQIKCALKNILFRKFTKKAPPGAGTIADLYY